MPNRIDYASIEVPRILHERLRDLKFHHRQSYWEFIEMCVDWFEESTEWGYVRREPYP